MRTEIENLDVFCIDNHNWMKCLNTSLTYFLQILRLIRIQI